MYEPIDVIIQDLHNPQFLGLYGENLKIYRELDMMERGMKYYENSTHIYNILNYAQNNYKYEIVGYIKNIYENSISYFSKLFS
jgi:hypothetical protein